MRSWHVCALSVCVAVLAAEQPWKSKKIAEWTEDEAKQVLTDSPWAKSVTPTVNRQSGGDRRSRGGGMGRGGGIGIGGLGIPIGIGGMGGGRRGGGMGGPGGPGSQGPMGGGPIGGGNTDGDRGAERKVPVLTVRWESAMPVQAAELKARVASAPSVDEQHYAIVVVGLPSRIANSSSKPGGELKLDGKKKLKPSDVKVLPTEDGATVIYLFPRSKEIPGSTKDVEFDAHIGMFELKQDFLPADMLYEGKLEL